jgi:hypothetical protein
MADDRPYLSYYSEHNIIPVRQNTKDMGLHFGRRRALYRHLGLHRFMFEGRHILEFGPGTGDNALYVGSCMPELYVLVDGNQASIRAISEKLNQALLPRDRVECHTADIQEYTDTRRFDVVLCEGVIPLQSNAAGFLARVASFAGREGLVVITTMSPGSVLAEMCRRVLKPIFSARFHDRETLLRELVTFFEPDLCSLPGMSRLHEDWVLDNILYDWPSPCTFTIPQAIDALDDQFDLLGTSPHFIQDWRWFKSIPQDKKTWNNIAKDEYARWSCYLLDYRVAPVDQSFLPTGVEDLCQVAIDLHHAVRRGDDVDQIPRFAACVSEIGERVAAASPITSRSIQDYLRGLNQLLNGTKDPDFATFRSWFGRGQQYASFVRRTA